VITRGSDMKNLKLIIEDKPARGTVIE